MSSSSSSSSFTLKLFIVHPSLDLNCSIASDVTAAMLLVKNKRNSKLFFHVNSSRKNSFVLTPNMAALSRGCKPRILCVCSVERNTGTVSTDGRDACTTYVRYTSHSSVLVSIWLLYLFIINLPVFSWSIWKAQGTTRAVFVSTHQISLEAEILIPLQEFALSMKQQRLQLEHCDHNKSLVKSTLLGYQVRFLANCPPTHPRP